MLTAPPGLPCQALAAVAGRVARVGAARAVVVSGEDQGNGEFWMQSVLLRRFMWFRMTTRVRQRARTPTRRSRTAPRRLGLTGLGQDVPLG